MKKSSREELSFGFLLLGTTFSLIVVIVGALIISSCEKDQSGLLSPSFKTPLLSSAQLFHTNIDLDTTASPAVVRLIDGTYVVKDSIWVRCDSGANLPAQVQSMASVTYRVLSADRLRELTAGTVEPNFSNGSAAQPTSLFTQEVSIHLSRGDAGRLIVEIAAAYPGGLSGNTISVPLLVTRRNSPPILDSAVVPDSIVRPTTGFEVVLFSAAVRDSDGYNDITEVTFKRTLPSPSSSITLFDDGNVKSHGDVLAGDGIFSRILSIDSTALLGTQVFEFIAKDGAGALSDPILDTTRVVQPQ